MNKIKILILAANPKDTDALRLDEEIREIEGALERSRGRNSCELIKKSALRVDDLRRALLDTNPQLVHFSGHGAGTNGIALENDTGKMQLVSTESLSRLFELFKDSLQCVFFNACYSETQANAIHQHIGYVIGMSRAIGDRAAIEFAKGFYDALGAGYSFKFAFQMGCVSIDLKSIPESATPVIKAKNHNNTSLLERRELREILSSSPVTEASKEALPMSREKLSQSISISGGTISGQLAQAGGDVNQTQHLSSVEGRDQLSSAEALDLLTKIELLINSSTLSAEHKKKAIVHLEAAKESAAEEEPDKGYAAKSLQKATKILKDASETVDAGKGFWSKVEPIITTLAPWLGVMPHFFGF